MALLISFFVLCFLSFGNAEDYMALSFWVPAPSQTDCTSSRPQLHVTTVAPPHVTCQAACVAQKGVQIKSDCNAQRDPAPLDGYVQGSIFNDVNCNASTWSHTLDIVPDTCIQVGAIASMFGPSRQREVDSLNAFVQFVVQRRQVAPPAGLQVTCDADKGATLQFFSDTNCKTSVVSQTLPSGCSNQAEDGGKSLRATCPKKTSSFLPNLSNTNPIIIGVSIAAVVVVIAVVVGVIIWRKRKARETQRPVPVANINVDNEDDFLDGDF